MLVANVERLCGAERTNRTSNVCTPVVVGWEMISTGPLAPLVNCDAPTATSAKRSVVATTSTIAGHAPSTWHQVYFPLAVGSITMPIEPFPARKAASCQSFLRETAENAGRPISTGVPMSYGLR